MRIRQDISEKGFGGWFCLFVFARYMLVAFPGWWGRLPITVAVAEVAAHQKRDQVF
jgi:hypothetical protein